jgi:hexokinase
MVTWANKANCLSSSYQHAIIIIAIITNTCYDAYSIIVSAAGRRWHHSNGFIHAARHHLAVSMVTWANKAKFSGPNEGKGAAAAEPARYSVPIATAGKLGCGVAACVFAFLMSARCS